MLTNEQIRRMSEVLDHLGEIDDDPAEAYKPQIAGISDANLRGLLPNWYMDDSGDEVSEALSPYNDNWDGFRNWYLEEGWCANDFEMGVKVNRLIADSMEQILRARVAEWHWRVLSQGVWE